MTTTTTTSTTDLRADPMPTAALGMWLFLAGEAMFFAALISAYTVLQSSPVDRARFVRSAAVVGHAWPAVAVALLGAGSVALRLLGPRAAVAVLAVAFLGVQAIVARQLETHRTVVTATAVYDGHATVTPDGGYTVEGVTTPLPPTFDVPQTLPADLHPTTPGRFTIPAADVRVAATYGPSRNNYFALYTLVTGAHAAHVVGGLIALAWLAVARRRRTATPVVEWAVSLYWYFVNGVGLIATVMLAVG